MLQEINGFIISVGSDSNLKTDCSVDVCGNKMLPYCKKILLILQIYKIFFTQLNKMWVPVFPWQTLHSWINNECYNINKSTNVNVCFVFILMKVEPVYLTCSYSTVSLHNTGSYN